MIYKDTISIMPDYGMAPFAWLRKAGKTRGIGSCIADSCGFSEGFGVSEPLQLAFAKWAMYFEAYVKPGLEKEFDWETFHARGRELTRRLKEEIGDKFNVIYVLPWEDPQDERERNYSRWKIKYLMEKIKEESRKKTNREQNSTS